MFQKLGRKWTQLQFFFPARDLKVQNHRGQVTKLKFPVGTLSRFFLFLIMPCMFSNKGIRSHTHIYTIYIYTKVKYTFFYLYKIKNLSKLP